MSGRQEGQADGLRVCSLASSGATTAGERQGRERRAPAAWEAKAVGESVDGVWDGLVRALTLNDRTGFGAKHAIQGNTDSVSLVLGSREDTISFQEMTSSFFVLSLQQIVCHLNKMLTWQCI